MCQAEAQLANGPHTRMRLGYKKCNQPQLQNKVALQALHHACVEPSCARRAAVHASVWLSATCITPSFERIVFLQMPWSVVSAQ